MPLPKNLQIRAAIVLSFERPGAESVVVTEPSHRDTP
jgi:hypothetical protein